VATYVFKRSSDIKVVATVATFLGRAHARDRGYFPFPFLFPLFFLLVSWKNDLRLQQCYTIDIAGISGVKVAT
jgi:hypothetical protein